MCHGKYDQDFHNFVGRFDDYSKMFCIEMLGELNTQAVRLSVWDKILLIKSKRVHTLRYKI